MHLSSQNVNFTFSKSSRPWVGSFFLSIKRGSPALKLQLNGRLTGLSKLFVYKRSLCNNHGRFHSYSIGSSVNVY
uniref:Uncharacterized protein n=1 Tax=Bacillus subtilis TaxID=1423 RepID=P70975_BACIU|nr:unknown [Bacillus subtilis] [Bacillus subtilis subsp. subtilis str. 168]